MCLITMIEKKGNKLVLPFDKERLRNAIVTNSDGIGIMYPTKDETGKLNFEVHKLKGTVAEQYEFLREHLEGKDWLNTIAIHMRYKTRGENDLTNVHPFPVLERSKGEMKDVFLMHNGTIQGLGDAKRSDTREFVEEMLRPMLLEKPSLWNNPGFVRMIEHAVTGDRVLLMDERGKFVVCNRKSWTEQSNEDGTTVLLSNTYSLSTGRSSYYDRDGDYGLCGWDSSKSGTTRPTRAATSGTTTSTTLAAASKENLPVKLNGIVHKTMDDQQIEFIMDGIETMSDSELVKYINENPEETATYLRSLHMKFKFNFAESTANKKEEKNDSSNSFIATGNTLTPVTTGTTA